LTEQIGNRLIELTVDECQALLGSSRIGRLGLLDADGPLIVPVNYCMDGRSVVFRTDTDTKLDAASNGASVAFEVDGIDSAERTGWSILIRGSAATVTEPGLDCQTAGHQMFGAAAVRQSPLRHGPCGSSSLPRRHLAVMAARSMRVSRSARARVNSHSLVRP
jgi:hypothetical protein